MSNASTSPADVVEELDQVIAEAEAAEGGQPQEIDATEKAREMGRDFEVDLAEVDGTGADGRVTVMDVDRFIKAREAEAEAGESPEASAESEAERLADDEPKQPKPKARKKAPAPEGDARLPSLPNIASGLSDIRHVIRSLAEIGSGDWYQNPVSSALANEKLGELMADGWHLLQTHSLGYGPEGINMVWVFGRFDPDAPVRDYPYREIFHVTRPVGSLGDDGRGLSESMASAMVRGYLEEGWDLAAVEVLDRLPTNRVNIMWVFVR